MLPWSIHVCRATTVDCTKQEKSAECIGISHLFPCLKQSLLSANNEGCSTARAVQDSFSHLDIRSQNPWFMLQCQQGICVRLPFTSRTRSVAHLQPPQQQPSACVAHMLNKLKKVGPGTAPPARAATPPPAHAGEPPGGALAGPPRSRPGDRPRMPASSQASSSAPSRVSPFALVLYRKTLTYPGGEVASLDRSVE